MWAGLRDEGILYGLMSEPYLVLLYLLAEGQCPHREVV